MTKGVEEETSHSGFTIMHNGLMMQKSVSESTKWGLCCMQSAWSSDRNTKNICDDFKLTKLIFSKHSRMNTTLNLVFQRNKISTKYDFTVSV